uniref:Uncharacterized protein LOC111125372 isoform X1 n=1 Tax=Crassostrea virginica TaxID=6565 RepID=A0A8B8D9Q2_CRAVI|nr:uncharacterized protein LOC111125372 isoform X1 [Crassostrea virginica]
MIRKTQDGRWVSGSIRTKNVTRRTRKTSLTRHTGAVQGQGTTAVRRYRRRFQTGEPRNQRFQQFKPGELNYVDVEFTKPKKKKKKSKKEKEQDSSDIPQPSVEYSEVIVKNSTPSLK